MNLQKVLFTGLTIIYRNKQFTFESRYRRKQVCKVYIHFLWKDFLLLRLRVLGESLVRSSRGRVQWIPSTLLCHKVYTFELKVLLQRIHTGAFHLSTSRTKNWSTPRCFEISDNRQFWSASCTYLSLRKGAGLELF